MKSTLLSKDSIDSQQQNLFRLQKYLAPYKKEYLQIIRLFEENPEYSFQLEKRDGIYFSQEETYKLLHCLLCENFPVITPACGNWCSANNCIYATKYLDSPFNK